MAANANVDIKTDVRACCSWLGAVTDCVAGVLVVQAGATALHYAAHNNSLEVAKVLVAANANVDVKSDVRAGCSWLGADY